MRENESEGEGNWPRPHEHGYLSPWTPRDEGETAPPRWPGLNPPEDDHRDIVAFGTPARSSGDGQDSRRPPGYQDEQAWYAGQDGYESQGTGYGNQPGYGNQGTGYGNQPGYGNQGTGYGNQGTGPGSQPGAADPWRDRYGTGPGAAGWAPPQPPQPFQPPLGPEPPGRPPRGGRLLVYVAVAALAASIGAGVTAAVGHHGPARSAGISPNDVPSPHNNASGSGSSTAPLDRTAVARKVAPGLVDIIATLKYNSETAEGTGMIVTSSGLVLTNNHVIDGATAVRATLVEPGSDSALTYAAQVVGYDATDDVALLRLQGASHLPTESFGNSAQVTLGTPVLALGNAEGHGGATPAAGIINALDRSIRASDEGSGGTENLTHMLQTNARIQQGDSGGALANNAGQVIGMITAAKTPDSGQSGPDGGTLGFAIPINTALAIARQIASGRASATVHIGVPGFLGVEVAASNSTDPRQQAVDEAQAGAGRGDGSSCQTTNQQAGVPAQVAPVAAGALILGVLCDTAAASAGMAPGDVITSVAGQPVTTPGSLTSITAKYHPGAVVSVIWVSLDGVEHTTQMMLGPGPAH